MSIDIPQNLADLDNEQLDVLTSEIQKRVSSNKIPKSIFIHELNNEEWKLVEKYAAKLNVDYEQRAQLSLKRLKVTVDAFLWSERTKKLEDKIMEVYTSAEKFLNTPQLVGIEDLLAANTDLLLIEKTSSKQVRLSTCNALCAYTVKDKPKDRGGRTNEMVAPPPDAPYWMQQKQQQQRPQNQRGGGPRDGSGGGSRDSGFFQQYRGQRSDQLENHVRQQCNSLDGQGRGKSHNGGRGRGGGGGRGRYN